ncbi:MAG: AMP-binding protein [Clostridia bacterium]|nr:AMP-binding protein [Clostridia bacterium]
MSEFQMVNKTAAPADKLREVAQRIREMREICGYTVAETAAMTEVSEEEYRLYEAGGRDFPFTFIHKCSKAFGIGITDLLEGRSAHLSSYTVTRRGEGQETAKEAGISIMAMAPQFSKKIAEPYRVRYEYNEELQNKPIHLTKHAGQEFDFVLEGRLKVQIGSHIEYLEEGDSIYYNSSTPHGMIAVDGRDCLFMAVVLPGETTLSEDLVQESLRQVHDGEQRRVTVASAFIDTVENQDGALQKISFHDEDKFNFAFDVVDALAKREPDKLAMLHVDRNMTERRFTFNDMKRASAQAANYFKSLGIKKGDRVMLVLKRHYQFWFAILGLHKLGAIAIPATNQLVKHDLEYRFNAAEVSAIVCTADGDVANQVDLAAPTSPTLKTKILVGGAREGWHNFDEEFPLYSAHFYRTEDTPAGDDLMIMFFTSGTTGYPKIAAHSYKYALGHYITAKSAQIRQQRESPACNFWYTYGGSVHKLNLPSTAVV